MTKMAEEGNGQTYDTTNNEAQARPNVKVKVIRRATVFASLTVYSSTRRNTTTSVISFANCARVTKFSYFAKIGPERFS
ncbi:hypothetical protein PPACK8108_LOCUS8090 [Phakopsora pachyrhizi]|uniref:Uncharacterized protein n=1 Tax=Phakopsora pachyrhizi TaxID=170000 RepID=A0AAV0AW31_PHAPC|nr:hypothetical protein PPACK8108_LOCUS8090 [Phakopsora pachyrhizi]